jgi:predicted RNase H-like HicB family nuclease
MRQVKIIVEKHPDGYVAYPLGIKGVVLGEGDTYEDALSDVKSALKFHIETFGNEALEIDPPVLETGATLTSRDRPSAPSAARQASFAISFSRPTKGCNPPARDVRRGVGRRKPLLAGRRHPLVEDGAGALEGDLAGGLEEERQARRRAHQGVGHVERRGQGLVEEPQVAHGVWCAIAVEACEEREALGVGLLAEHERRIAAGAGEHGRGEQSAGALAEAGDGWELRARPRTRKVQAEAAARLGVDRGESGHLGLVGRGRLVALVETAEEGGRERLGRNTNVTILRIAHESYLLCGRGSG